MSTPKSRPPMTEDQLAKLAVAREKALAVRRAQKVEKLKAEAARLEGEPSETTVDAPEQTPPTEEPLVAPIAEEETPPPPPTDTSKSRTKKKKPAAADPVVVVEQSSDDEDTFEAPPGVIFVKRRRAKQPTQPDPSPPQPPPSAEDMAIDYAYRRMVNGEFHMGMRR